MRTDSKVTEGWAEGLGAADPWVMLLVEILRRCAERQDDTLSVKHIPGINNIRADAASRGKLSGLGPEPFRAAEIPAFPCPYEQIGLGAAQWVADDAAQARELEPPSDWRRVFEQLHRSPGVLASLHPLLSVDADIRVQVAGTTTLHTQVVEAPLPRPAPGAYEAAREPRLRGPAWDEYVRAERKAGREPVPPARSTQVTDQIAGQHLVRRQDPPPPRDPEPSD